MENEEALKKVRQEIFDLLQTRLHMARDLIEDPSALKACGYKTLEEALTKIVTQTCKEEDRIFKKYERENPL